MLRDSVRSSAPGSIDAGGQQGRSFDGTAMEILSSGNGGGLVGPGRALESH